jgi:hypothetical protein
MQVQRGSRLASALPLRPWLGQEGIPWTSTVRTRRGPLGEQLRLPARFARQVVEITQRVPTSTSGTASVPEIFVRESLRSNKAQYRQSGAYRARSRRTSGLPEPPAIYQMYIQLERMP